jgi:hypothetical protein
MRVVARIVAMACAVGLVACGGGDGMSAADLEAELTAESPIEEPDPVVEADCADDLPDETGAEVVCTTTTKSGVESEVTVISEEDGFSYSSVSVGGPAPPDPGPTFTRAEVDRIERGIFRWQDRNVGGDPERVATAVDCPADIPSDVGSVGCMVTLADGSVINYTVEVDRKGVGWFPDPIPADILAHLIVTEWNGGDPGDEGESADCPDALTVEKGAEIACTLTTAGGETHDATITLPNATGDVTVTFPR